MQNPSFSLQGQEIGHWRYGPSTTANKYNSERMETFARLTLLVLVFIPLN